MSNPRKRDAEPAAEPVSKSKKRRKSKNKRYEAVDDLINTEKGINEAIALMDSQLLTDYVAQKTTRFGTELSSIELSDLSLPAGSIKDTTSWQAPRTLDNLPAFLEKFADDPNELGKASSSNGSPHTLIVAGAGLRSADVVRGVRKFQSKGNAVAKLFAKHMKVEEQVQFLKSHRAGIAVGTPARLSDLIENGALSMESLRRIVVDASHVDQKKRGVLDMKDTMMPLAKLLTRKEFKPRYTLESKPLDLLFY